MKHPQIAPYNSVQPRPPRTWRDRIMRNYGLGMYAQFGKQDVTLPKWIVERSVVFFLLSFAACTFAFGYPLPLIHAGFSVFSVLLFFYGSKYFCNALKRISKRSLEKNIFLLAIIIRLVWVLFAYLIYNQTVYGKVDGYGDDNGWYMDFAKEISLWLQRGRSEPFADLMNRFRSAIDDVGYPIWLAVIYFISGDKSDVLIPLLIKALISAYSCLCIYQIARRHFDEGTARLAGLFMCFNPYLLCWCSFMLKETEMVFLCCLALNQTDKVLSNVNGIAIGGLILGILAGGALFFFRAPLAIVFFLSIIAHVVFVSQRVMSAGKKVIAGVLVGAMLMVGVGDRLQVRSRQLIETVQSDSQKSNMEWRSVRKDASGRTQSFAKYAGAAVFAPLIFTIPFPTFNMADEGQLQQMQLSGGNYIKNVLSFFVIVGLLLLLFSGEWRRHVFILAYTLGYLMVLIMSNFAQSGRFHMPVMPMLLLLSAYGIQIAKGNKKIRNMYVGILVIEIVFCVAWNWFKLAGRGMI